MLLLMSTTITQAQITATPKLPVDEKTKLICYSKAETVANITQDEFYKRALSWANSYFKNPKDVIREYDRVQGKIVCKARFKIMNPPDKKGFATDGGNVQYTLDIQFKDGKYKYDLTEINWKQPSYYAAEKWLDATNAGYKPEFVYYLKQVDDSTKVVIKSLDKAMHTNQVVDKKEEW